MKRISLETILRLMAAVAVTMFCVQVFSDNKADVDLWGNAGFVAAPPWSSQFHRTNTFSFTEPDHPWINHEWLAQYVIHTIYEYLGSAGLLGFKVVLGLIVVLLMHLAMKKDCPSGSVEFFYLLLVISTMGYGFSTRPHLFTYVFYALFLFLLRRFGTSKSVVLVVMPALGIIWVNLHGAFFIGILLMALAACLELARRSRLADGTELRLLPGALLIGAAIFAMVSVINPYGFQLWGFIVQSFGKPRPYLSEWAMFDPMRHLLVHSDFLALALMTIACLFASKKQKDVVWIGVFVLSLVAAVVMRRNIPLFAITAAFVVSEHVCDVVGRTLVYVSGFIPRLVRILILAAFIAVSAGYTIRFNKTDPMQIEVPQDRFPVEVVNFMAKNNLAGNALVFFDWAEYCIWKVPQCRVFLDGRFQDAYSTKTIDDYFSFLYARDDFETALRNYPVDILLLHNGNPVSEKVLAMPEWKLVFGNDIACLFLKSDRHKELISAIEKREAEIPSRSKAEFFP